MAEPSPTTTTTPKRKRGEDLPVTPIKFSFDPSKTEPPEEGNSPRTIVAHRFRGLALDGGGGGAARDELDDGRAAGAARKRARPDEDVENAAKAEDAAVEGEPSETLPQPGDETASAEPAEETPEKTFPVVELPSEHRPSRRRRAGTPPLRLKKSPAKYKDKGLAEEPSVTDPVRAALTWHEDEITIYDPDDDDDDGTGINGVGFKPTPALAQARAMKRRQQMAEYRRREENEARTKRSQRRRGETAAPSGGVVKKRSPTKKVRFIDAETQMITITTI